MDINVNTIKTEMETYNDALCLQYAHMDICIYMYTCIYILQKVHTYIYLWHVRIQWRSQGGAHWGIYPTNLVRIQR